MGEFIEELKEQENTEDGMKIMEVKSKLNTEVRNVTLVLQYDSIIGEV
jgi:hypothetical protein